MSKDDKLKWDALMRLTERCLKAGNAIGAMIYLAQAQKVGR